MSALKGTLESRSPSSVSQIRTVRSEGETTYPTAHRDGADPRTQAFSSLVLFVRLFIVPTVPSVVLAS